MVSTELCRKPNPSLDKNSKKEIRIQQVHPYLLMAASEFLATDGPLHLAILPRLPVSVNDSLFLFVYFS